MFSSARLFLALLLVSSSWALTLPPTIGLVGGKRSVIIPNVIDLKPAIGILGKKRSVDIPNVLDLKPAFGILGSKRSVVIPNTQQGGATPANTEKNSVHSTAGSGLVTLSPPSDNNHQRPNLPLTARQSIDAFQPVTRADDPGDKQPLTTPNSPKSTQKALGQEGSVTSPQLPPSARESKITIQANV